MRHPRLKADPRSPEPGLYHCLSRVVDRRFVFGVEEKNHFVLLARECERFCRVRILTFAVMSNHFHLLVEVPPPPPPVDRPGPEEIVQALRQLSGHQCPGDVAARFALLATSPDPEPRMAYLRIFHARMWDISYFMKMLKQRFTQWYNARTGRKGTLWEERFRSVLVEGQGRATAVVAAYIDLNPVRAGLVGDPTDYPWCGYAEASYGSEAAARGIQRVARVLSGEQNVPLESAVAEYGAWLLRSGSLHPSEIRSGHRPPSGGSTLETRGPQPGTGPRLAVPVQTYLRARVRYFCDGVVLGSRRFVDGIFCWKKESGWFGPRRRSGARRMRGLLGEELFVLRDLRKDVFGSASPSASPPRGSPGASGSRRAGLDDTT